MVWSQEIIREKRSGRCEAVNLRPRQRKKEINWAQDWSGRFLTFLHSLISRPGITQQLRDRMPGLRNMNEESVTPATGQTPAHREPFMIVRVYA